MLKKMFCVCLAVLMLCASVLIVAANTESEDTNINEHLVTWWNFEGDAANALKDKATKGTKADDLTKVGDGVTVENGVASIPSAVDNYLWAEASADFNNVSAMTIYVKAQYSHVPDQVHTDFADLICYPNLYRVYKLKDSASANGGVLEATAFGTTGAKNEYRVRPQTPKSTVLKDNEWFYYAVSMEIDGKVGYATVYISNDGKNYEQTEMQLIFSDTVKADLQSRLANQAAQMVLGKLLPTDPAAPIPERYINFQYDDVRFYDTVLTADELATIIPNSLALDIEEQTTTTEEITTETPTEEVTEPATEAKTEPATEAKTEPATEAPVNEQTDIKNETNTDGTTSQNKGCTGSVLTFGAMAIILSPAVLFTAKKKKK